MVDVTSSVSIFGIVSNFFSAIVGTIVGAVLASFKIDKRLSLLEQKISLYFDGDAGLLKRMSNIESAINARRIVDN